MNMQTTRLYYKDSHIKNFTANVLECIPVPEKECYFVILDQTAFFPIGGGQPADKGTLNDLDVLDVYEDKHKIIHKVKAPLPIGSQVIGIINWEFRFSLMQHHSGEHIVSGLVHKHFGYDNIGFHMGTDAVTMDFSGILTESDIRKIELLANKAIYKDVPIIEVYPSNLELETIPYRSKKELDGQIRIVVIPYEKDSWDINEPLLSNSPYYDICACCAPHMKTTGEIGCIKLISAMKYKGGTRVSMLCGFRALEDYNTKEEEASKISNLLSCKINETSEAVIKLKEEATSYKGKLYELYSQLFHYKAKNIPLETENICEFEDNIEGNLLRQYCNTLLDRCSNICIVFSSIGNNQYKYIIASKKIDVLPIGKLLNEKFNGRGGGSKEMVQGFLNGSPKELQQFFEEIKIGKKNTL